jgi:hypothetical protein
VIFRMLWPTTHLLGRVQAWLAAGFREGTILERLLIFPAWLVFRVLFVALFAVCEAVV